MVMSISCAPHIHCPAPFKQTRAETLILLLVLGREMEHPVVSAGGGAINILVCKLGTVLIQEAQLLGGIRGELQYMKDELESMTSFLQDLGSTTSGSGLAGLFHRCIRFLQTVRVRRQIAKQIQELKARATSISDR
uniref:Disease resistance N-terminal domain-containing protein n=1 Tax=Aegilops tauschii subsp. strangulata TaxID=200361 RepID=A0A453B5X8_AEGTS